MADKWWGWPAAWAVSCAASQELTLPSADLGKLDAIGDERLVTCKPQDKLQASTLLTRRWGERSTTVRGTAVTASVGRPERTGRNRHGPGSSPPWSHVFAVSRQGSRSSKPPCRQKMLNEITIEYSTSVPYCTLRASR